MIQKIIRSVSFLCFLSFVALYSCNSPSRESSKEDLLTVEDANANPENRSLISWPDSFGFGREAVQFEIDSLSIAILPDGTGLPIGEGTALQGKGIYLQKCAACHGPKGKEGPQDVLVNRDSFLSEQANSERAIGNYWPYSTTVFDYIRRAMPSNAPGSLTDQEVYQLTAWLLFQNGLISESHLLNSVTLPQVAMPARELYVIDNRTGGPNPIY